MTTHGVDRGEAAAGTGSSVEFVQDFSSDANAIEIRTAGTSAIKIDSSQQVSIGVNSAVPFVVNGSTLGAKYQQHAVQTASPFSDRFTWLGNWSAASDASQLVFSKSRNATVGGHTVLQDQDTLGIINFQGSDGTDFAQGAVIAALVDGTPGNNDMPGKLSFQTTSEGASSSTERMSIGSDGVVNVVENMSFTQTTGGVSVFRKNLLINPDMRVAQRGTSISCPNGVNTYTADRWIVVPTGNTITTNIVAGVFTGDATYHSLRMDGAASVTSIVVAQRIEQKDCVHLADSTCTLSFWVHHDKAENLTGSLKLFRANAADNFAAITQEGSTASFSIAANGWARVSATFDVSVDAITGLQVHITFDNGLAAGKQLFVTGVQLEEGAVMTEFERRPIAQEYQLCLRYYERSDLLPIWSGSPTSGQTYYITENFRVIKRSTPTMTYTGTGQSGFAGGPSANAQNTHAFSAANTSNGTLTSGYFQFDWVANAEL